MVKLEPAVGARPHRRHVGRARLLLALPVGLLLTCLPGAPAAAQSSPTTTVPAAGPSSYRLGRVVGNEYVFDVPVTADFGQLATCTSPQYPQFKSFCTTSTESVGGSSYKIVRTEFTWDERKGRDQIDSGGFAYSRQGYADQSSWVSANKKAPGWPEIAGTLRSQAWRNKDKWSNVRPVVLASPSPAGAPVRLPIPELEQARLGMVERARETVAGTYYPGVTAPKDLAGFQAQMLSYGNTGRRDPDFRKKNGSQTALNLGADYVQTLAGSERVFHDNKTPPYFNDQRATAELSKAAQFQAEYVASLGYNNHNGPSKNDPSNRTGVDMSSPSRRSVYFGGPANVVEGIAKAPPGEAPDTLMKGDTHFRPFFNVGGFAPEVGYGAAQSARGDWFFVFVTRIEQKQPTKTLAEVSLPATSAVGVASPPPNVTVTVKAVEPTATQTTGPSSIPPGATSALAPTSTAPTSAPLTTTTPTTTTTAPIVRGATTIYGVQSAEDCASIPAPAPGKVRVRFLNQDPSRPPAEDLETDLFLYDASTPRATSVPQFVVPAGTTFDVETTSGTTWRSIIDDRPELQRITVGSGPTQCERGWGLKDYERNVPAGRDEAACKGITPATSGVKVRFVSDAEPEFRDGKPVDATIRVSKVVWNGATATTEEALLLRPGQALELRAQPGTVYQVKRRTSPYDKALRDFDVAVGNDPTQCVRFPGGVNLFPTGRR